MRSLVSQNFSFLSWPHFYDLNTLLTQVLYEVVSSVVNSYFCFSLCPQIMENCLDG